MNEAVTRTRVILDKKIEERFPLNYDAIQELAEKANALNSCLFVPHCSWHKGGESKYIEYIAFHEVINKFYIGFVFDLEHENIWEDLEAQFLGYKLLFNLISNDNTKLYVEVLNACKETTRAWELFNRIEYLINNFETEILLSDTEDTEDV